MHWIFSHQAHKRWTLCLVQKSHSTSHLAMQAQHFHVATEIGKWSKKIQKNPARIAHFDKWIYVYWTISTWMISMTPEIERRLHVNSDKIMGWKMSEKSWITLKLPNVGDERLWKNDFWTVISDNVYWAYSTASQIHVLPNIRKIEPPIHLIVFHSFELHNWLNVKFVEFLWKLK